MVGARLRPVFIAALPHYHMATLLKQYPHSLVIQPGLHELGLAFLGISLEAEEARSIAFIDANFKVSGGVEQGQLFPFTDVGVGFTDLINHFIPLKNDLKAPALPLFLKFFPGDVYDHVLEMVYEDDLAFNITVTQQRFQGIFDLDGVVWVSHFAQFYAGKEVCISLCQYARAVQGVSVLRPVQGDTHHLIRQAFQDHGHQPVIGHAYVLVPMPRQQEVLRPGMEKIHQDEMETVLGKITNGVPAHISRLRVVERGEVMTDIHDVDPLVHLEDLALYRANKKILAADI